MNEKRIILGIVGLIGSGKDTAADYFVDHYGFQRDSFANSLKDALAAVFGWDRNMLEGRTPEARSWREQTDLWWSERLGIPITPRKMLQQWGTEICRQRFHNDIWVASLENKLSKTHNNIVITDARFPNEIEAIRRSGGRIIQIKRGPNPSWFELGRAANSGNAAAQAKLKDLGIHASETSWIGSSVDYTITNNGTVLDLYASIKDLAELLLSSS